jgi:hypothetical protein
MKTIILSLLLSACALGQPVQGSRVVGPVANATRLAGKPLCSASVTTSCVKPLDANGNFSIPATVLGPKTIGAGANQLPAAAAGNLGWITVVTDAASGSDCTVGSGTSAALCRSNGSAWVPLGGGGGGTTEVKTAITYSQLTAAATTQDFTLVSLPANAKIVGLTIKHSTAFTGTDLTNLTVSLGRTGAGNEQDYSPQFSVYQAVASTTVLDQGGHASKDMAGHDVIAHFIGTFSNSKNFSNCGLANGSVTIWVRYITLT